MVAAGFQLQSFTYICEVCIDPRPCVCCQVEKKARVFQIEYKRSIFSKNF